MLVPVLKDWSFNLNVIEGSKFGLCFASGGNSLTFATQIVFKVLLCELIKPQSRIFISVCLFRLCPIKLHHMSLLENCVQHRSHSPPWPAESCGGQSKCWGKGGVIMSVEQHIVTAAAKAVLLGPKEGFTGWIRRFVMVLKNAQVTLPDRWAHFLKRNHRHGDW